MCRLQQMHQMIKEYQKLTNLGNINISLSNGSFITTKFESTNMPHLLGFQYINDVNEFNLYSQKDHNNKRKLSATKLLTKLDQGLINLEELNNSKDFQEVYNTRMKLFTYENIVKILLTGTYLKFDKSKVRYFNTKLDNVDYLLWIDSKNGHFQLGLGFSNHLSSQNNYNPPITFFVNKTNEYVVDQQRIDPLTMSIDNYDDREHFKLFEENCVKQISKNKHFKNFSKVTGVKYSNITEIFNMKDFKNISLSSEEYALEQHYKLELSIIDLIYRPYLEKKKENIKFTNNEKDRILKLIKKNELLILPSEIALYTNDS